MVESRIGESLKAARARVGWSREALAYHSGVSWSAIAQIESGRRKDVRLTTLSALADALKVSVDYLVGTTASTPQLSEHRVLPYRSEDQFIAGAIPFLGDGIEKTHALLVVATEAKTEILRDALEDRSEHVEFADWSDWYRSPQEALSRYGAFVRKSLDAGAVWIRIVGEAAWSGDTDAEIATWTRYESMVNLAFASSPTSIICTYDERSFPVEVVADARTTHPVLADGNGQTASPTYRPPEEFLLEPQNP